MTRRESLKKMAWFAAAAGAVLDIGPRALAQPTRGRIGIGMYSGGGRTGDPLKFLEYARETGAAGVQVRLRPGDAEYAARLRAKVEEWGMYIEGDGAVPRNESALAQFERDLITTKESGGAIFRTALLSGRRYENFNSAEQFEAFEKQCWTSLQLAEPMARKHKIRLAIENHKDHLVAELLDLLKRLGSEYVGVTLDTGNNISLCENPYEVVEALAPVAFSVHLKDMGVEEYADGFLLSEVPMGTGFLDMKRITEAIRKASPQANFNIEMITRDPLHVPCLTDRYWVTLGGLEARVLARALALVKANPPKQPLPRVTGLSQEDRRKLEDENIRKCVEFGKSVLGLS